MRHIVTGDRLAIRVLGATPSQDALLAVPPIPPGTPRATRVRILEYVLRRQPALAYTEAHLLDDVRDEREAALGATLAAVLLQARDERGGVAA